MANLYNSSQNLSVTMDPMTEFGSSAYYSVLTLNYTAEHLEAVVPSVPTYFNPGNSKTMTLRIPARSVALVLVCPTSTCTF